ncbi:MAG: hypothetical protein RIS51_324 [Actinomycetota bacterium]
MKLERPRLEIHLVNSESDFLELVETLSQNQGSLGLDAERASGFRYSHKAYLIQIADPNSGNWLVDPIATSDENLWAKLNQVLHARTWILHAATQDLPCLADLGLRPSQIFDTEVAAKLIGLEKVGLGSIASELLELDLAKEHSASDWSQRPLSEEMLSYAALDVDVLHDLEKALLVRLEELGRLSWMEQEMQYLVGFRPKAPKAEPWRSLPGVSKFREIEQIQIAASLWTVRDRIAREQDIAPGRLIPDRSISTAATMKPKTKSELAANKEFHGRASRTMLDIWWQAILDSKSLEVEIREPEDPNYLPNHRSWERRFPEAHARLEAVRPKILELATTLGIPPENLLSPDSLRRVCFEPAQDIAEQLRTLRARQWQLDLVVPVITAALVELQQG